MSDRTPLEGAVEPVAGARNVAALALRLWAWEFLLAGMPPREMGAGGLFAEAIGRAPLPEEGDTSE
jgi:hypothetical protein